MGVNVGIDGITVGTTVGTAVGVTVGVFVGFIEIDGTAVGVTVGVAVGVIEIDGTAVVGVIVGTGVAGAAVGACADTQTRIVNTRARAQSSFIIRSSLKKWFDV